MTQDHPLIQAARAVAQEWYNASCVEDIRASTLYALQDAAEMLPAGVGPLTVVPVKLLKEAIAWIENEGDERLQDGATDLAAKLRATFDAEGGGGVCGGEK